jgi:dipeptidase E
VSTRRLLLLSNSKDPEGRYLVWPEAVLRDFLGPRKVTILFVPYAGVTVDWDAYTEKVRGVFAPLGHDLAGIHRTADPAAAVRAADVVAIGGGNTWRLTERLHALGVMGPLRERAIGGMPLMGWSAGAVIACPTMQTTNDMCVVPPASTRALDLVPFQINPHYTDFHPPGFQGETRAERLAEFIEINPGVRVIGIPECTLLRIEGDTIAFVGAGQAPVFERGRPVRRFAAGDDLRFLLAG